MNAADISQNDAILEDEIRKAFRVKDVPEREQAITQAYGVPVIKRVRMTRANPGRKRLIAQAVQREYHKLLKDTSILSNAQLIAANIERGEWSAEKEARMEELKIRVQLAMDQLYLDGFDQGIDSQWQHDVLAASNAVRETLTTLGDQTVIEIFNRWASWSPDRRAYYDETYAASQGLEQYSPDRDFNQLLDAAPDSEMADHLNQIEDLMHRLDRYRQFRRDRYEMLVLQDTFSRITAESVESQREAVEQMAQLYFCTEQADATAENPLTAPPQGRLTPTFEQLWDLPQEMITWLLIEHHFFKLGLPDEARELLALTSDFQTAGRETGTTTTASENPSTPSSDSASAETTTEPGASVPSVGSPVPPSSKAVSAPAPTTPAASSVSPVATTSTTSS